MLGCERQERHRGQPTRLPRARVSGFWALVRAAAPKTQVQFAAAPPNAGPAAGLHLERARASGHRGHGPAVPMVV